MEKILFIVASPQVWLLVLLLMISWQTFIGTIFENKKTSFILIQRDAQTFLSEPDLMKLVP